MIHLSVIIPAYNEAERLPKTLKKVRDYLSAQNYDWEVLIVNDGSNDTTPQVVKSLIKDWKDFRLIDNQINKGKGGVVKQGMLEAQGDWRLFMDADNSTDISEIEKLFEASGAGKASRAIKGEEGSLTNPINSNYPIIIGSRYLKADSIKIKQPFLRRVMSRLGNILARILLGVSAKDTQCGFKLFSGPVAERIFPLQTISRWGFDMEVLAIARRLGYRIKEVPVDWYDAEGSQVKKGAALKTLKELLIIKWNLITQKYLNTNIKK